MDIAKTLKQMCKLGKIGRGRLWAHALSEAKELE